jgi:hypothetical protein
MTRVPLSKNVVVIDDDDDEDLGRIQRRSKRAKAN